MKIHDILLRDPAEYPLINQGQARISDDSDPKAREELRGELSTFVCEGQFSDGLMRILRSFLENIGRTSQKGVWVSGFYGSGKSHALKMAASLWQDTTFDDGATARSLVPHIPEDLRALLRELETAGKRAGGLLAAAGALPSGTTENVRLTILSILLKATGLPGLYPQARFCLWLDSQGWYERVQKSITAAGKNFVGELNNLYVSGSLARAVLECDPKFAASEAEVHKSLRAQFPPQSTDITTEAFIQTAKEALRRVGKNGRIPCTILILDEVQQYIGDSNTRSTLVTEVAEAVSKQLDSHVIIVGAGQSALTDVPLLHKLLDRFTIRVPLSDVEVETVTRKVLLQKKPTGVPEVRRTLDTHAGEVSRHLQGTRLAERTEDRATIVEDYPLLPVRRRFWEHCFRQVDAAGTQSQLRSQLSIIHSAVAKVSTRDVGAVVPADELFESIAPNLVNTGVLLRESNERIIKVGKEEGQLSRRICGLVFLIGKLKRDDGLDTGVRANKDHIADLLVDDLAADNGKLRSEVEAALKNLAAKGVLMTVGDEYRLQTREGSEWDREFRNRQTKLNNDDATIQFRRDELLYGEAERIIRTVKKTQGLSKESRSLVINRDATTPAGDGASVTVWVRDGWSCAEKEVVEATRSIGAESPLLSVFVPHQSAEDLRRLVVEADAAQQTLDTRGLPSTPEGQEARQSMESRKANAASARDRLVRDIVANAKVFQGGGSEVIRLALEDKIRDAADESLIRLFPRFKEGDSNAWEVVLKRARDGADHPFQPAGHTDATEKHPVCQQVIATIGSGKTGTEVRKALQASPFGWPRDAIDAALIALHRSQHLSVTLNGAPVALGQLDQNKIQKSSFRVEQATLSVQDRLALRKLFGQASVTCKGGEEAAKAGEFLQALVALASAAGGEAPLPAVSSLTSIEDMQRLAGNQQLTVIRAAATQLETNIKHWTAARDLAAERLPSWNLIVRMAGQSSGLPEAKECCEQIEAIRAQRSLLQPQDAVSPLRRTLADLFRGGVQKAHRSFESAYAHDLAQLEASDVWQRIDAADRTRILSGTGLSRPATPDVSTDEKLLSTLEMTPLSWWHDKIAALPGRFAQAAREAAELLEPKVQHVHLSSVVLHTEKDVKQWLAGQEKTLLDRIKSGPVVIS
ncbi:MAG: BREX system P-loop protein BrxC [Opitutaceae bacterium]|jgi:hypothetical protein